LLDDVYQTGVPYVGNEIPIYLSRDTGCPPELRYFNFSYQPMFDENKVIYSILVFGYEVTEQVIAKNKNTDDHLLREKLLEENVQQRTIELSKANKDLLKMNTELQAFTFVSSHDLQEPLRKIRTFAKLILEREVATLSDKGKDYFQRIQNSTSRMQTLIEDLLVYSQANVSERIFEVTSLEQILQDVKTELSENITGKQAVIEADLPGQVSVIRFQFRQLFSNIISNSLKFSNPDIAPVIHISGETGEGATFNKDLERFAAKQLLPEVLYYHLSFVDNGVGFESHFNEKIFQMFQRLHGEEEYPGTGIGLAIVKKIVENHDGLIFATSEIGNGAAFHIYIPMEHPATARVEA
jgi:light-regulated signal transduction histidine kinase (bacteriophytochrome)